MIGCVCVPDKFYGHEFCVIFHMSQNISSIDFFYNHGNISACELYISRWSAESDHRPQVAGPVEDPRLPCELGQEGRTVLTGEGTTLMEVNPQP